MDVQALTQGVTKVSQRYAEAFDFVRDDWYLLKLQGELGELTQSYLKLTGRARGADAQDDALKTAFAEELADGVCYALLAAAISAVTETIRKK